MLSDQFGAECLSDLAQKLDWEVVVTAKDGTDLAAGTMHPGEPSVDRPDFLIEEEAAIYYDIKEEAVPASEDIIFGLEEDSVIMADGVEEGSGGVGNSVRQCCRPAANRGRR